jgi:hypothetical protein
MIFILAAGCQQSFSTRSPPHLHPVFVRCGQGLKILPGACLCEAAPAAEAISCTLGRVIASLTAFARNDILYSVGWVERLLGDVPVLQCTSETQQLERVFVNAMTLSRPFLGGGASRRSNLLHAGEGIASLTAFARNDILYSVGWVQRILGDVPVLQSTSETQTPGFLLDRVKFFGKDMIYQL